MDSLKEEFEEKKNKLKEEITETKQDLSKSIGKGVSATKSFVKKLMIGLLILGILSLIGFFLWGNYTYSEGTRSGHLIKISKKGYVMKTFEGQLKLGGIDMKNEDEGLSDTWSFSVTDNSIYDKLEKMQGQKVVLHYKEINYSMPWQGDTEYFIYEIEEAPH